MPRVYRTMTRDGDKPMIGNTARTLGVRIPGDIRPDEEGNVRPGTGGMSVAPSWRDLPSHRIPQRLRALVRDAWGKDGDACWRMGEGSFEKGKLAERLTVRVDSEVHGLVEPAAVGALEHYRRSLAGTQDQWVIDEE